MFKIFQEYKTISWIVEQESYIDFSPSYQRMSNIWKKEQKQLLIDSIINGFDIPKLYFHFLPQNKNNTIYNYSVIDGKQRLEAILEFINDKFSLSDDFKYLDVEGSHKYLDISGKKFSEIESIEPAIISRLLQYKLCVVFIDSDNPDTINETFIRLNSGINVNTAEKRNAIGGELAREMNLLYTSSEFFTKKIRLTNARYAHFDLALKLLMIELGYEDLGRATVNKFVKENKDFDNNCRVALESVKTKLSRIITHFSDNDKLLSKKSLIVTFFSIMNSIDDQHLRPFLSYFEETRNNSMKEDNKSEQDALMIEFTRLLQQGADKKNSLEKRREIMEQYLYRYLIKALGYSPNE